MTAFDPWDDSAATPPAFVPPTPEELAAFDALLVEMKLDSDALFEEVARNRDADDALLLQAARDGADALEEMLRNHPRGAGISPGESPSGKPCEMK